jgi:hypothetical protein
MQDTSTYRCQAHPEAEGGTRLINHRAGTNVFVENWNKNATWTQGFPYQWVAYEAKIYINGVGQPWLNKAKWTQHSCADAWPPESAIGGDLVPVGSPVNDGYAFFNLDRIPLYCE